ncbi:uncharacterized protein YjdB [Clostridium saccharoperbutylacetonicum]|uniref:Bacterial surface protein containing Ig-like domain n=1 Tax=Clostridium saccharoperbutylacetonicum N1-4(HMT) TaxID=931276 RepID=M1MYI4_9CLOT|nr:Ig-like domain-containing protein [Clostridium saccharoperbutylacetonicum]AGF56477.1 bacterial surface protein containing Ig-like domain [Clostridium saccharoperbutylacetonicum N1-4(HMT)]NRT62776.1 uncharacterized protein YjdB [Clostridium saccharoperbutylacetonicum]NSB26128.1 uncharacterized protein YjdB [Clostridium saccharoperbutylacetonicum]NSB45483.1 uncharacterized protein YjdB [Clostridium saccharoperbutylacetonicum]
MKNYFKKFSIMFVMSLTLMLGCCVNVFAADDFVTGTTNLNNTTENSATRGVQLTAPEKGWKRYDNNYSGVNYTGNWQTNDNASDFYNKSLKFSTDVNAKITFYAYTSKIRFISPITMYSWSDDVKIKVDDNEYTYSHYNSTSIWQTIVWENLKLEKKIHKIEITNPNNTLYWSIDAIDIAEDGYIVSNDESITLDKSTMNLTEGETGQLIATTTPAGAQVTWKSSDPSIATIEVDPTNGKITKVNALKEGTCTITATIADGSNLSASCTINITKKTEPTPDNPTTDSKTGAILIINLTDGETKVFDVSSSEVDKFKSWYNNKSEFENKLTYVFNKTVNSNISVEEDVVHNQITSFEIRKY